MHTRPAPTARRALGSAVEDDVLGLFEGAATPPAAFYGAGKAALRDAVRLLDPAPDANVLLPSYLPDGVVEPFREAGLTVRFYCIDAALRPLVDDVEARLDDGTAAVVVAHYFGFPQDRVDALRTLCDHHDTALVADNAHAPLSRRGDELLATAADLGVTSFHKLFAVPDGAALLIPDDDLRERRDRLSLAGVADEYARRDAAFLARSTLGAVPGASGELPDPAAMLPERDGDDEDATAERDPRAIYLASKTPLSKLSAQLLRRTPRHRPVERRRANARFWLRRLDDVEGISPVFESLPDGVCPQALPVVVDDPAGLAALSDEWAAVCSPWPPLPTAVDAADEYETASRLAGSLVRLPVHQQLSPDDLRPHAAALHRWRDGADRPRQ